MLAGSFWIALIGGISKEIIHACGDRLIRI